MNFPDLALLVDLDRLVLLHLLDDITGGEFDLAREDCQCGLSVLVENERSVPLAAAFLAEFRRFGKGGAR